MNWRELEKRKFSLILGPKCEMNRREAPTVLHVKGKPEDSRPSWMTTADQRRSRRRRGVNPNLWRRFKYVIRAASPSSPAPRSSPLSLRFSTSFRECFLSRLLKPFSLSLFHQVRHRSSRAAYLGSLRTCHWSVFLSLFNFLLLVAHFVTVDAPRSLTVSLLGKVHSVCAPPDFQQFCICLTSKI